MTGARTEGTAIGRKASRDFRRQQLVEATIAVLSRKGYAALTIADVAKEAGLSAGIVNFHFESKDKLLASSLEYLAEDYRRTWTAAVAGVGPDASAKLRAMLFADFDDAIFTPQKLAAWIAFWGETQGRPVYDAICASFDRERAGATEALCAALIKEGEYGHDAELVARSLDALSDGLWYGMVSAGSRSGARAGAEIARRSVELALAAFFPKHFGVASRTGR